MYTITFRCPSCGCVFKKRSRVSDPPDPVCPNLACSRELFSTPAREHLEEEPAAARQGLVLNSPQTPAVTGSLNVKAIEETARIVMEDQKLPNLLDNARPGEASAPRLAPKLQTQADGFFAGGPKGPNRKPLFDTKRMARRALAGSFSYKATQSPDPIAMTHAAKMRPATNIVVDDRDYKK